MISSLDEYYTKSTDTINIETVEHIDPLSQTINPNPYKLPDNVIFNHLSTSEAEKNCLILARLGIIVTPEEMVRIGRVFRNNIASFMTFFICPAIDVTSAVDGIANDIRSGLQSRLTSKLSNSNAIPFKGNIIFIITTPPSL